MQKGITTAKNHIQQELGWWTTLWPTEVSDSVADPQCARGGGVSHILAEKRGVSFTLFKKMHENSIFSPRTGWRTPGAPYAGSATAICSGAFRTLPIEKLHFFS